MRTLFGIILGFALGVAFILGMGPAPAPAPVPVAAAPAAHMSADLIPAPTFEAQMRADAIPTVRLITSSVEGGCSAVALAPGIAMTAQHCISLPGLMVDGHAVAKTHVFSSKDVALLEVPGLECPCAAVAPSGTSPGDRVAAVGFPYGMGPHLTYGESQGSVIFEREKYLLHTAGTTAGMSGGGVFIIRGGVVLLTAITSRSAESGTAALSVSMVGIPTRVPERPRAAP